MASNCPISLCTSTANCFSDASARLLARFILGAVAHSDFGKTGSDCCLVVRAGAVAGGSRDAPTAKKPLKASGDVISRAGAIRSLSRCVGVVGSRNPDEVGERLGKAASAAAAVATAPAAGWAAAAMSASLLALRLLTVL
jgi:hypothetical protein